MTEMTKLPFYLPGEVCSEANTFDRGYLEQLLPELEQEGFLDDVRDIRNFLSEMVENHSTLMLYKGSPDLHNGGWFPCNYAYRGARIEDNSAKNTEINNAGFHVRGRSYEVTGFGKMLSYGDESTFLNINPSLSNFVLPQFIVDNLKGLVIAQEYPHNRGNFGVELLIGDNFDREGMMRMPDYTKKIR